MKLPGGLLGVLVIWVLCFSITAEEKIALSPYDLLGPDSRPPFPRDKSISDAEALDIAEAAFKYQFQQFQIWNKHISKETNTERKPKAFFLSLFSNDSSPKFLKRLKEYKLPFKKGTEFRPEVEKWAKGYHDKGLRMDGLAFVSDVGVWIWVSSIKRVGESSVAVKGGNMHGPGICTGGTYIFVLKENKWIMDRIESQWFS